MQRVISTVVFFAVFLVVQSGVILAQSTSFTYQGSLQDSGAPATGSYDFQFALFSAISGGSQIGTVQTVSNVSVAKGIFSVSLDFGEQFPGASRFLETRVRQTGGGAFTTLLPRQLINSSPYSVKSLTADNALTATNATNAVNATTATNAGNANQLGGVNASQFVQTTDSRLSDARTPLPNSPNYIQNTISQQPLSNFNVSGSGTTGGTFSGQRINSTFEYSISGQPFLNAVSSNSFFGVETGAANFGLNNTYTGYRTGTAATSNASNNSFFGANAGRSNSNGLNNSFFGVGSGELNTFGGFNSFFGNNSGAANTNGNRNTFVGVTAGRDNVNGSDNTFVGTATGQANQSGGSNSFFGTVAGVSNTTGSSNSFFGNSAGQSNVSGTFNTAIGTGANVGAGNLNFATAIGSGALVSSSNTVVIGRSADTVQIPGTLTITGTFNGSGITNLDAGNIATGILNPARLNNAVILNSTSSQAASNFNISGTGAANILNAQTQFNLNGSRFLSADANFGTYLGQLAGNPTGQSNSFFGNSAGRFTSTGGGNSFFGALAGGNNIGGNSNSFFGASAGGANQTGNGNSYFGASAGFISTGGGNSFFGSGAGIFNTTGSNNVALGFESDVTAALTNAVAIGWRSRVTQSNSLVLGSINGINNATADTNVGIGTTAPTFKLQVVDPSNTGLRVQTNTVGGTVASFGGVGAFQVDASGSAGGRFIILENGTTGIGTNTPNTSSKLHVNGNVRVTNGSVYITNPNTVIITSPNGACWGITVNNSGVLSTFPVNPCP